MTKFVGIAGGTGSGKTTVARALVKALPTGAGVVIELDSYYRDLEGLPDAERAAVNFDHPSSLDFDLLVQHLGQLGKGEAVEGPIYDFKTHRREETRRHIAPCPVVVVEGIFTFVDARVREKLDLKLFVDTEPDVRLMRRIRRDMEQRGRSFESIREQYRKTVAPMHREFIEPTKRFADLILPEGGENRVGLDVIAGKLLILSGALGRAE
jgi:uridine kinase